MSAALKLDLACQRCRGMRHVWTGEGYERCPDCFTQNSMLRELSRRNYPAQWASLNHQTVIDLLGASSPIGQTLSNLAAGRFMRAHLFGANGYPRQAVMGSLAVHYLQTFGGCQVLDTRELAWEHFREKDRRPFPAHRTREPVVLQLGHEVETKLGMFYCRALIDTALQYDLPFVLVTDAPLEIMCGRYEDLMAVIEPAGFDVTNVWIPDGVSRS